MASNGDAPKLILASGSAARQSMLRAAGLSFDVIPADVDEAAIRDEMLKSGETRPADIADALAIAKAEAVSAMNPEALVIGGDQILACGSRLFEKPRDRAAAHETLSFLQGKTHQLHSSVALALGGGVEWQGVDTADLEMRAMTSDEISRYLAAAGDQVLSSVGAYQLEGLGVQLFERVSGDYFTVLGMPLLSLLAALRERGVGTI